MTTGVVPQPPRTPDWHWNAGVTYAARRAGGEKRQAGEQAAFSVQHATLITKREN